MSAEMLRLFVAIELPLDVRAALERAMETLRRGGIDEGLRWVRPEAIHITLKFLGATPEERLPEIQEALRRALGGRRRFRLQPAEVGSFGGRRGMRVVWVGMGGDIAAMAELAGGVERAVAPLGYPTERRPFAAHLTLARVREDTPADARERMFDALKRVPVPPIPAIDIERVSLMQSDLARGGARYTALETYPLE